MGNVLMDQYTPRKTLSPANQFQFVCPIFHREVKLADCMSLHDGMMVGRRRAENRGCIVAHDAMKCPVPHIVRELRDKDDHHSAEPVVGHLSQVVLQAIAPILVMEKAIDGCTAEERACLLEANELARAGAMPDRKPRVTKSSAPARQVAAPAAPKKEQPAELPTQDMAGLVNAMMAEEAKKPAPVVETPKPMPVFVKDVGKTTPTTPSIPLTLLERAKLARQAKEQASA